MDPKGLNRYGYADQSGNSQNLNQRELIDQLSYVYAPGSNQLLTVSDQSTYQGLAAHFVDGNTSGPDYEYDLSGNLTKDLNQGITNIQYNYLNKPTEIAFNHGGKLRYYYAADGSKLYQEVLTNGQSVSERSDYLGGMVYEQDPNTQQSQLAYLTHAEGRLRLATDTLIFEYFLKDHLGNNRVMFGDNDGDGLAEALQEDHYYPFGLKMGDGSLQASLPNVLLYNGKEIQDEMALGWYDYGARMMNPTISRWNGVDALAEDYSEWSPYNYTLNNPIRFIDPDGNSVKDPPITYYFTFSVEDYDWITDNEELASASFRFTLNENNDGSIEVSMQGEGSDDNQGVFFEKSVEQKDGEFHLTLTLSSSDIENETETTTSFSVSAELSQSNSTTMKSENDGNSSSNGSENGGKVNAAVSHGSSKKQKFTSDAAHVTRTYSFSVGRDKDGKPILTRTDHHPDVERRTMPVPTSMEGQMPNFGFEGSNLELLIRSNLKRD